MKFTVRIGVLGLVFVVMFSVVGLRLWFLQVAEGPAIAASAEDQTWISKVTHAPRGDITDRNGTLLATSRIVPAVFVDRALIQPEERTELVQRLAAMLAIDPQALDQMYEDAGTNGRFQVGIVSPQVAYQVVESLDELPGVEIVKVPERVYLSGPTLAHVIGHLGIPDEDDLEARPDLDLTLRIGQLGVEAAYDEYLQGTAGSIQYRVRRGDVIDQRPPKEAVIGDSVELTIDLDLQQVVELALEDGIRLSNEEKDKDRRNGEEVFSVTTRAAAVVLDVRNFEVLAIASVPDFHPFASIGTEEFRELNTIEAFNNLAAAGEYPPASTFKAITYAAFEEMEALTLPDDDDVDPESELVDCDGELVLPTLTDGSPQVKHDWYYPRFDYGWMDIHDALTVSCNIFFWNIGKGAWDAREEIGETVLQDWAKALGYGSLTGLDIGGEQEGAVPTRELFEEWAEIQRADPSKVLLHPSRLEGSLFQGGDLMDFAIGQGAFTATPLQVAVSYAALVNGGIVREPRVVRRILGADGTLVESVTSPVVRTIPLTEEVRRSLLADLHSVVVQDRFGPDGTAWKAFRDFGPGLDQVGGKTGTAEASGSKDNHAWFVGVAPLDSPRYVVAVVIEEGGSGGAIAAPVARFILQYLMGNTPTEITAGDDTD